MRSGQALFSIDEVLLECYVDDPLALFVGDVITQRTNRVMLLPWWRVLGPAISWGKMELDRSVNWIGATMAFPEGEPAVVEASLPDKFAADLRQDVADHRAKPMVAVDDLRRLAGKGSWAANVGPALRNFLQPRWKVIGDTDRASKARPTSAKGKEVKRRALKRGGSLVETCRVRTALDSPQQGGQGGTEEVSGLADPDSARHASHHVRCVALGPWGRTLKDTPWHGSPQL